MKKDFFVIKFILLQIYIKINFNKFINYNLIKLINNY